VIPVEFIEVEFWEKIFTCTVLPEADEILRP